MRLTTVPLGSARGACSPASPVPPLFPTFLAAAFLCSSPRVLTDMSHRAEERGGRKVRRVGGGEGRGAQGSRARNREREQGQGTPTPCASEHRAGHQPVACWEKSGNPGPGNAGAEGSIQLSLRSRLPHLPGILQPRERTWSMEVGFAAAWPW